jgi:acetyltransferase-like isoleucine patch superfamily enzyme
MINRNERYAAYSVGDWTYGTPTIFQYDEHSRLTIGKFCSIGDGVTILVGGEHRTDWLSTYPFNVFFEAAKRIEGHPASKGDIAIGNDVWIGANSTILSGVSIGDGAVIGAASLVCRNVDPYSVVAGNPARQIRLRFEGAVIEALVKIAWWNWPIERIEAEVPLLMSGDVQEFIQRFANRPSSS